MWMKISGYGCGFEHCHSAGWHKLQEILRPGPRNFKGTMALAGGPKTFWGDQSPKISVDQRTSEKATRESNRVHSLSRSLKTRLGGISWNGLAWKDGKGSNTRTRLSVGTLTKAPRMLKLVSNWIEYISVKINVPKSVHYYVPQNSSEMNRASRNLWVRRCSVSPITVSYYWDAWWIYSSESLELSDDCTGYAEEQEPEGWKEITKQVLSFFKKTLP